MDHLLPFAADQDEGFVEAETWNGPYAGDAPEWSFSGLGQRNEGSVLDDGMASDLPDLGSRGGEELQQRLEDDFPEQDHEDELALVGDDEVHEIHVSGD